MSRNALRGIVLCALIASRLWGGELTTDVDQRFGTPAAGGAESSLPVGWSPPPVPVPPPRPAADLPSPAPAAESPASGYCPTAISDVFNHKGYPKVQVTGFFQADALWVHQSRMNINAVGDAQDGADFRRARLAAVGDVWHNVGYYLEFDFGFPGRPSFMDVWLEVRDVFDGVNVRVGQYRQPIGMDALTSVRELSLIERALTFAFLPFRQIGAMAHGTSADESLTWAVSGFRFPTDQFGGNTGDSGGYGLASRITGLLVDDGDARLVHLGGAYSFADPSQNLLQYRNQPEAFIAETGGAALAPAGVPDMLPFFVDTGPMFANHYNLFGGEAAARSGSFYVQSEVLISVVSLRRAGGSSAFHGGYVQAGYILTGEVLPYDRKNGVFGRIVPRNPFSRTGGRGAWEINARLSHLDLDDGRIRGGKLTDLTLGLNWYLNQYVKFQLNYIHAFLDSPLNGDSDAGLTLLRAQLDF